MEDGAALLGAGAGALLGAALDDLWWFLGIEKERKRERERERKEGQSY